MKNNLIKVFRIIVLLIVLTCMFIALEDKKFEEAIFWFLVVNSLIFSKFCDDFIEAIKNNNYSRYNRK